MEKGSLHKMRLTPEEQETERHFIEMKKACDTALSLHNKIRRLVIEKKRTKSGYSNLNTYVDRIRDQLDMAYLVTRKERIKADLKNCLASLFFWDDTNEYKDI